MGETGPIYLHTKKDAEIYRGFEGDETASF